MKNILQNNHGAGRSGRRVLIVTPTSLLGGAERNILLLARHMPRESCTFSLATTFGTGDLVRGFREQGLDAEEFRYAENPLRIADLFKYVERIKPDLIHSFLLRGNWIAWALTRKFRNIPWIASERGLDILRPPWKASANKYFLAPAQLVLAVSAPVKDLLIVRDRIPAGKIEILNGGIPPAAPPLPLPPQLSPGSPETSLSHPRIVTLGHFRTEKNIGLAIRALAFLREKGLDASLTLIGDGAERSALERMARELGVTKKVIFAGNILEGRRLLSHFDILLIPSKEEGFPNVMLEAWQAGIPVISTDTPGAREISGPDEGEPDHPAACLVEEALLPQKLFELVSSKNELATYANRGVKRANDFSIDRTVKQLTAFYDRFL